MPKGSSPLERLVSWPIEGVYLVPKLKLGFSYNSLSTKCLIPPKIRRETKIFPAENLADFEHSFGLFLCRESDSPAAPSQQVFGERKAGNSKKIWM